MPPVGFKVFDVRPGAGALPSSAALKVSESTLENERYTVKLDAAGDVISIFDRGMKKELLSGPARLELLSDISTRWPAWEITWAEASKPARAYAGSPRVRVVERGPVRVALEVTRTAGGSAFVQRLSLAAGGDRLDFDTRVDWKSTGTMLKASFPFTASSAKATYDLGLGTIERPNAQENLYEVPGQQWADLTDRSGGYGAAIFNDGKYGWDKPGDSIVRLTLIHTPKPGKSYVYQSSNDIGRHHFVYSIAGHAGDWRTGCIPARAARLNQPLLAFQSASHTGPLGRTLSMLTVQPDGGPVAVRAFKKAEDSEEIVLRIQELYGKPLSGVRIALPTGIAAAREVNAAEEPVGPVEPAKGLLVIDLARYQTRTFLLKTAAVAGAKLARPVSTPLVLPFDIDGVSMDAARSDGDFDGRGRTIPGELFPAALTIDGVNFQLGPGSAGAKNILAANGQRIALPPGTARLHLLAAAIGGDQAGTFSFERAGALEERVPVTIDEWEGAVGQWDSRLTDDRLLREEFLVDTLKDQEWPLPTVLSQMAVRADADGVLQGLDRLQPAFVKRERVAWVATHRHNPKGNEAYSPAYLFRYVLDVPAGATAVILPENGRIRVFAATAARGDYAGTVPAGDLYAPELPRRAPAAGR
jgi:alpha-mannosidase